MGGNSLLILVFSVLMGMNISGYAKSDQPNQVNGFYTVNVKNISITVDANIGARIISFKIDGNELLSSKEINRGNYGSSLWLSPENKWNGQGALDAGSYTVDLFDKENMRFTSKADSTRGFIFVKQFFANPADTSVVIKYSITNISSKAQEVAPWEVTRVRTGGLAMFPKGKLGDVPIKNKVYPLPAILDIDDIIWYPYDSSVKSSQKVFMNGSEGWIAYIYERAIFIKLFPVIEPSLSAPGEKNVEMYINRDNAYQELENQGAYQKLSPGQSLTYEVRWFAKQLPNGLKVDAGNPELPKFIRKIIRK